MSTSAAKAMRPRMRPSSRRRCLRALVVLSAFVAVFGVIVGGITLVQSSTNAARASVTPPQAAITNTVAAANGVTTSGSTTTTNGSQVHYMAYDAAHGSNDFGPAVDCSDATSCSAQIKVIDDQDPLHFAVDKAFAEDGLDLTLASAQDQAAYYANHHDEWMTAVDDFVSKIGNGKVEYDGSDYRTLGMIPGSDQSQQPTLFRATEGYAAGKVYAFTYEGVTRKLRLACGMQPVENFTAMGPIPHRTVTEVAPPVVHVITVVTIVPKPCVVIIHLQANQEYTDSTHCQVRTIVQPPQPCKPIVPLPAGQHYTSDDHCKIAPNPQPKPVQVCNPATGQIITVPADQADQYKPKGDQACQPKSPKQVQVCNPATGHIITVNEDQAANYKPVDDAACKPVPPPVKVCNPATGKVITVPADQASQYKPEGDEACQPKPVCTPKQSPGQNYQSSDNGCTWVCVKPASPGSGFTWNQAQCTWLPPVECQKVSPPSPIGYVTHDNGCTWEKDNSNTFDCQQNGGPNCPPNHVVQPPQVPGNGAQAGATQPTPGVPTTAPVVLTPGPGAGSAPPATSSQNGYVPPASSGGAAPGGSASDSSGTHVANPPSVIPTPAPCTTCGTTTHTGTTGSGSATSGSSSGSTGGSSSSGGSTSGSTGSSSGSDATTSSGATNVGDPGAPQG